MTKTITPDLTNRARGALLGLAIGDALGTTLEFTPAMNPFTPQVTDMVGGGPFRLPVGGWTDDTSMALCLGDSLVACAAFDARDQMNRYLRWRKHGENSVLGRCFDIGTTTSAALSRYEESGNPFAGATSDQAAGNGSLMRLVPVVVAANSEAQALLWADLQSRTTHGAREAVDACRLYAKLIWHALSGASKADLLDPALAEGLHLAPAVAEVAAGSYQVKTPPAIKGTGYVVAALEAALWAFAHSADFAAGALLAVNLGQDADTTGAIFGQLAGACYGLSGVPTRWVDMVLWRDTILALADALLALDGSTTPDTLAALDAASNHLP